MSAQLERRCTNCGSVLLPGATNCTQCGAAASLSDRNASGAQFTLDSIATAFSAQPTISSQMHTSGMIVDPAGQTRPSGVMQAPAGSPTPAPRLPLIPIIIGQSIVMVVLLMLVIASLPCLLPWIMKPNSPTLAPTPTGPHVLYQADWSSGLNGWAGSADWSTSNGQLVDDGTESIHDLAMPTMLAPFNLSNTTDYAIEARIQITHTVDAAGFGFFVRYDNNGHGYIVGAGSPQDGPTSVFEITPANDWHTPLQKIDFTPGTSRHAYRIEVQRDHITVSIDGGDPVMDVTDGSYPSGEFVGLWDSNAQLTISSFVIESV